MYLVYDISKWQGNPNFNTYKAQGATGVIHKAGGSNAGRYVDSQYRNNAPAIRAAGLALGHYWFNGEGDPTTDADFFVNNLTAYAAGDILVLDVESEGSMAHWNRDQALAWLRRVYARTGTKAHVYMSSSVTRSGGWEAVAAEGYPLWVASYGSNNGGQGSSPSIGGWANWSGWQYTSNPIDKSVFNQPIGSVVAVAAGSGGGGGGVGRNVSNKSTAWIQQRLNDLGHYGLVVDGVYGAATTAAVADYQHVHGLAVDGIAGNQTVTSLAAGGGNTNSGLAVDGIWGINTTKALQRALGVTADGILGPQTYAALQRKVGVPADGVVGPVTRKGLQRYLGVSQDGIWGPATARALQARLNSGF